MAKIECGMPLSVGAGAPGSGGCLARMADEPDRVLLLTAGHAVVAKKAAPGDPIKGPSGEIGKLETWSTLNGDTTADVALVWVDPAVVSVDIVGLGTPVATPAKVKVGDQVRMKPRAGTTAPRVTTVKQLDYTVNLSIIGPDWPQIITFRNQIRCQPSVSDPGDSGAILLDAQNRVIGMLVGGVGADGDVVTPIGAILDNATWKGNLELLPAAAALAGASPASPQPALARPLSTIAWPASTDFSDLKPRYEALFAACVVAPAHVKEVGQIRQALLKGKTRYEAVAAQTGAPWWFIGIVHGLECSFKFNEHLHNGDPLTARTVRVPAGHPEAGKPPFTWEESANDAITLKRYDHQADWSLARTLYRLEGYNGYGYYKRKINSPYLWSYSTHYKAGKFVQDGVYDAAAVSKQCGAAVLLKALIDAGDVAPFAS